LCDFADLDLLKEYIAQMLRKRDWEEAALIADYAVKLAPGDAGPREALARIAAGRGDYKQAVEQMRGAVKLKPSDADLALELALLELLAGNYEAALDAIPVTGTGQRGLALVIRGMALHKKGERVRALGYFKEAAGSNQPFIAAFAAALLKSK
jgi:tetratricopeptide (TPR) repeat protein